MKRDRVAGRATALDVAPQIGFTHTSTLDDPRFEPPADNLAQIATNAALQFPPLKEQLGVLVYAGVTELGMSGLVDRIAGSRRDQRWTSAAD